ncbi:TIM-barrel domain-containing protein [uncultured Bacteroides sp.]|uniref:TIM-barrel domain-containing protein n=1 Tax=uncultured Bacteroides sp. TaxID=162156 RepID=UPI002AAC4B89|nr:TIM-barrel domain-containing protein [uncultured Bacteroides sp.]
MKKISIYLLAALLFMSCAKPGYEKTADGIIVNLKQRQNTDVKMVRLQVMNDKVIHVSATPENKFSEENSLIIVPHKYNKVPFSVENKNNAVVLSTSSLKALVNLKTGEVSFTDSKGNSILRENEGGGKSFNPIEVEGTRGYTMRQVFESPDDEAFYGLGQHQSDEFNYKGKNEDLFQYNTKVTVPFVLSNKNYGILWDNYSYSKFGDNREYAQLDQFRLYDADGKEGGLTATYVPNVRSGKSTVIRTESTIDYEDLKTIKNLPQNFPLDGSNVTYTGELEADQSGVYRFWLYYAGYTEVYINNVKVVPERWRTAWNPNCYKFSANFEKGKRVPIRIEWKPDGGVSYLALKAFSPVPDSEQKKLSLYSEMGNEINYYFIKGNNMDEVISGYRTLTGKSPVMPKWAMGYWQSRQRYKTQSELLGALKEFRRRQIPIDNIILDWFYWPEKEWGSHDFDLERFPDAKAMIDSIHQMNAKIMISVWPKFYVTTDHYKEFDKNGWMYQQAVKDSVLDWVGKGYVGSFYDAYSADARKLFWKQMNEKLYSKGIDAWWMDASEPDVYSNNDMAYRKKLCGPTVLGPSTKYFNTYALMNAKAIYEGQRGVDPDKRVFLLTRSGFAGLQRYSTATWSGDIGTRWEDMKAQIPAGLNFSMSGVPYWTMDIGGFCTEKRYANGQHEFDETGKENADLKEWRELNARWYQFGAFAPLFRAHGEFPFREVFNIAPENHPAYKSIVYYTKLRYNMMPYIYSLAGMTYFKDYTIMRALVMDFGKDTNVNNISDQYMFGPSLMICPVYKYEARSREVYFPETTGWYDFYTGEYVRGGQTLNVNAPYERIPLFVREGAIIPYGPDIQYTNEKPADHITLYIYGGQNGSFTLYEDEGDNYNYEKGRYATIEFTYDESSKSLIIGDRKGEFNGMLKERTFNVVYVDKIHSQPFDLKTKGKKIKYNGKKLVIKL